MTEIIIEKGIPAPRPPSEHSEGSCNSCWRIPRPGLSTCDYHLAIVRRDYKKQKAKGACTWGTGCHNPIATGRTMCREHLRALIVYSNARRAERKAQKLCIVCGERPQWWAVTCILCRDKNGHQHKDPLPNGARKALAKYRRFEKIDARRAQAEMAIEHVVDERAREILTMRHGLGDGVDRTLEEIGAHFGVTRERIRQIESAELKRLEGEGVEVNLLRSPFEETQRKPPKTRRHLTSDAQRVKANCHRLVSIALASGELKQQPCHCGNLDSIAHHRDYSKPLEVEWLCRTHHMEAHRGFWLDHFTPQTETGHRVLEALKQTRPTVRQVEIASGVSGTTIKRIISGAENVRDGVLLRVIKFCESLNANNAVN